MAVIELENTSKWYGEVIGLNNVSCAVSGGITGLVGPNGAGKSTLMGIATGQLRPNKGRIRVLGANPWNNPRVLGRVGFCPEGDPFWTNLTGRAFVRLLARMSGLNRKAAHAGTERAIERTGMQPFAQRRVKTYSKGMRQRIKMAQALVHEPELLILDEPFTGADPISRRDLADLFRTLARDGVHILISSHVLHEVESLTRQILMIHRGRIVAEGELGAVRRQLHNRPHAIRIRATAPRALAANVAQLATVTGLQWPDGETLVVQTTDPADVYDRVGQLALAGEVSLREIAAADESLEAVFGYLTDRSL